MQREAGSGGQGGTRLSAAIPLWIIAVVAALVFLRAAATLLIPIVLAIIISYALEPLVAWMERHHVRRLLATVLLMMSLLGLFAWGAWSLQDNVAQAAEALPRAAHRLRALLSSQTSDGPAASVREAAETLQGSGEPSSAGQAGIEPEPSRQPQLPAPFLGAAFLHEGVQSIFALLGHAMVVVFLIFFLLATGHHFRNRLIEVSGPELEGRKAMSRIIEDINTQIQRFLLVQCITAVIVSVATWAVLAFMDFENAVVWAMLAGVFNSIPYFGPVIVSGGLLLVGLVQDGGVGRALQMSGAALVITSVEGWLITPPLMGRAERMSALSVFLGLLLWTWLWGAWGTLLAVPMLVILKSVADHVDGLHPLGRLLAP